MVTVSEVVRSHDALMDALELYMQKRGTPEWTELLVNVCECYEMYVLDRKEFAAEQRRFHTASIIQNEWSCAK